MCLTSSNVSAVFDVAHLSGRLLSVVLLDLESRIAGSPLTFFYPYLLFQLLASLGLEEVLWHVGQQYTLFCFAPEELQISGYWDSQGASCAH